MASHNLLILPGDGIGPEVAHEVEKVTAWFSKRGVARFETERDLVGGAAYDACGAAISDAAMKKADQADAVLFGAVGGQNGPVSLTSIAPRPACSGCARI